MNPELFDFALFLLFSDSHLLRSASLFLSFLVVSFLPYGFRVVKPPDKTALSEIRSQAGRPGRTAPPRSSLQWL